MEKIRDFICLGIETSCDETAAAVISTDAKIMSNIVSSQIDIHSEYGGVVPEIASRHHLENINPVVEEALMQAKVSWDDIGLISVTQGPGLVGALLIGLASAKAYALAKNIPIVGVNHMKAHIASNYLDTEIGSEPLKPPFLTLLVSGGHTELVHVRGYDDFELLGRTGDDAVGEAYDKVARVLGLGYPGGPKIDALARKGDPQSIKFPRPMLGKESLNFSFSGIKTAVLNYNNRERQAGREVNAADLAASFQAAVIEVLIEKTRRAAKKVAVKDIAIAGGVAANSALRQAMSTMCKDEGFSFHFPKGILSTDNAAMVAMAGRIKYLIKGADSYDLDAFPNLDL